MPFLHHSRVVGWLAMLACLLGIADATVAGDLAGPLGAARPAVANPLADVSAALGEPVAITAAVEPGRDGGADALAVTARLEPGWHLYSVTQKPGGPIATRISVAKDSPRSVTGPFVPDADPHRRTADDVPAWKGLVIEEHAGVVTWRAPLAAGAGEVRGSVSLQLCQETTCLPPQTIAFTAGAGAGAGAAGSSSSARLTEVKPPTKRAASTPCSRQPPRVTRQRRSLRCKASFSAAAGIGGTASGVQSMCWTPPSSAASCNRGISRLTIRSALRYRRVVARLSRVGRSSAASSQRERVSRPRSAASRPWLHARQHRISCTERLSRRT